jgi:membrane-associated protein
MEVIKRLADAILHMDRHLGEIIDKIGVGWVYVLLFAIIFCETGLVVTPILPGDSLLFTVGALCGVHILNLPLILILLSIAAVAGDNVNYWVGYKIGPRVFKEDRKWLNRQHLEQTHSFYEKYGGKTLVIARFLPIIRTFAPFVAGIGKMSFVKFTTWNVAGGLLWVWSVTLLGYWFGNRDFVKKNFGVVILAIIFISILPAVFEIVRAKMKKKNSNAPS